MIEVRPTIMVSGPRLFENIYAKVMDNVLAGSKLKKKIFFWALRTGSAYREKLFKHQPIPASLRRKHSLAHRLVFSKILEKTVGKPIPDVDVKIAPEGEILARGPNVMRGYYKLEKETQETLEGGWLHTGDIGHLDEEGYLVITDRTTPYLAPYEKVKKIALLDRDFELERGEITPTLKVKRKIIEEKYKDLIDGLYRE